MQVPLTPNELQVITDAIERHNRELLHEIARTDHREFKRMLQEKLDLLADLPSRLAQGELRLMENERDALNEVLRACERALYFEVARTDDREFKQMLRKNLESLEIAHSKITGVPAAA